MRYKVTLNGKTYEVEVDQERAMLADEYAAPAPAAPAPVAPAPEGAAPVQATAPAPATPGEGERVTAPMPGNILKILAAPGQRVQEGDALLVLEAMKMENEITSPRTGVVAQITVNQGDTVETGATLAVIS